MLSVNRSSGRRCVIMQDGTSRESIYQPANVKPDTLPVFA